MSKSRDWFVQIGDLAGAQCGAPLVRKVSFPSCSNQGRMGEEITCDWFRLNTELEDGIRQRLKLGVRSHSQVYRPLSEDLQWAELPLCLYFPMDYKQTYLLALILSQLLTWIPRLAGLWIMNASDQNPLKRGLWKTIFDGLWSPSIVCLMDVCINNSLISVCDHCNDMKTNLFILQLLLSSTFFIIYLYPLRTGETIVNHY